MIEQKTPIEVVKEIIEFNGVKRNGLTFVTFNHLAEDDLEDYAVAMQRQYSYDTNCIHQDEINESLNELLGKDIDRDMAMDIMSNIKTQMCLYYSDQLEEDIEKELEEINFPDHQKERLSEYESDNPRDTMSKEEMCGV